MIKMHRWKILVLVVGAAAAVVYGLLCQLSFRFDLGRRHPELASAFFPPWFNFEGVYTRGDVLQFRVGMSRREVVDVLRQQYISRGLLRGACGKEQPYGEKDIYLGSEDAPAVLRRDVICLWVKDKRLSVNLYLNHDVLERVEVGVIRTELL